MSNVLTVNASARTEGSTTRRLVDATVAELQSALGGVQRMDRDVAEGVPFVDQEWVNANFTPAEDRTTEQAEKLALSNTLIAELRAADIVVIGVPMYNFSVPAALKAWFDQVARAKVTFQYTPNGPEGLLTGKTAVIVTATGGVPVDSPVDFSTPYLKHFLGFIGIKDVHVIAADRQMADADAANTQANTQLTEVVAKIAAERKTAALAA